MQTHTDTMKGPTTTAADDDQIDWKAELEGRWQALGRRVFVTEPERPPALREILDECSRLAIVWALVQTKGKFTYATRWLETSRKVVRRHFLAWRRANPSLIPMPYEVFMRWSERHGGDRR